ncbi:PREDICTED: N(6)-adenine-specific DNA methyltransferase 2 [Ceratosolen solmsi marchali]|uniref:Protein-lysine N-methyltransferase LOC105363975 n=1 Tax=Ceratosolen solmsi marchali TaxID=326594 RepID=A0AAJ7DXJ5_9HYME|nr:PREDICTED: N(6)-adenine-specific DNA methyltransferase 2 [Ceratosolen solmsi marchali]
MSESDDDIPRLNSATLAALNEFYQEKEERENKLKHAIEQSENKNCDIIFEEDWQLSQFWYDEKTILSLTRGAVKSTLNDGKIALISCPTLYKRLSNISEGRQVKLFEFDKRFSVFGSDFILYDYNLPQNIPNDLIGFFDLVICDPPFLSEECLTKVAVTVKLLAKNNIVLCTGAVMNDMAGKLLNVKKCNYAPHHKNNLANEFCCYSNFCFDKYLT